MIITQQTSLDDLFSNAKLAISDLHPDEKFTVKDLFRGFEWNRIPKNLRTKLGMAFFRYANDEASDIIQPIEKTPQNQQRYKLIKSV